VAAGAGHTESGGGGGGNLRGPDTVADS